MGDCSTEKNKLKEIILVPEKESEKDQLIDVGFISFDMISIIGAGAFARVMLARRRYNSTLCALKIMYKQGNTSQKTRISNAFRVEKTIMVGLNHPKILKLHYSVETENAYVLVMEYCPGGDIFNHVLMHNRFPEQMAKFYAAQIVSGLNYMHSEGVIYRDLKPENLFLTKTGYLRFGDFGLSIPFKKDTAKAKYGMAGTLEFFAPEIVTNSEYDESVDWWSFGCVLYFMLTASFPFKGESRIKLCENILKVEPIYPAGLSPEVVDLLKLSFAKEPTERLNGKSVVDHPWFKGIEWSLLADEKYTAPFIPKLDSEEDVSLFDKEFTSLKIEDPFTNLAGAEQCSK